MENRTYTFFDMEYVFKGVLLKTYMLWRIIEQTKMNIQNKVELYVYFCNKFNLMNNWHWCFQMDKKVHKFLWDSNYPADYIIKIPRFLYLFIRMSIFFVNFIPHKKIRKDYRNKLKQYLNFPNKKLMKRYFKGA